MSKLNNLEQNNSDDRMVMVALEAEDFIKRHTLGLWEILEASPNSGGLNALGRLIEICDGGMPRPIEVEAMLRRIERTLIEFSFEQVDAIAAKSGSPRDLQLAILWNLGRVNDLVRKFTFAQE